MIDNYHFVFIFTPDKRLLPYKRAHGLYQCSCKRQPFRMQKVTFYALKDGILHGER